jgi:hypothetical protein
MGNIRQSVGGVIRPGVATRESAWTAKPCKISGRTSLNRRFLSPYSSTRGPEKPGSLQNGNETNEVRCVVLFPGRPRFKAPAGADRPSSFGRSKNG